MPSFLMSLKFLQTTSSECQLSYPVICSFRTDNIVMFLFKIYTHKITACGRPAKTTPAPKWGFTFSFGRPSPYLPQELRGGFTCISVTAVLKSSGFLCPERRSLSCRLAIWGFSSSFSPPASGRRTKGIFCRCLFISSRGLLASRFCLTPSRSRGRLCPSIYSCLHLLYIVWPRAPISMS